MRAAFRATVAEFLVAEPKEILGHLTAASVIHPELLAEQIKAWQRQIDVLKTVARKLVEENAASVRWSLLLEYAIPRRGKRPDAVLLADDVVLVIEFKVGADSFERSWQEQTEDYALDLRDFHEVSRGRIIVPILVATNATAALPPRTSNADEPVLPIRLVNEKELVPAILSAFSEHHKYGSAPIDAVAWDNSPYHPVPTIIEAARTIFAGHNVREIARAHAPAHNLTTSTDKLIEIIRYAERSHKKVICFLTGIPGAGKTLCGLHAVHLAEPNRSDRPSVAFLSGNGPLVRIVSEALIRDHSSRENVSRKESRRRVSALIQNIHAFIDEYADKALVPHERVTVFDEAQRAWDAEKQKKERKREVSEPKTMLQIMDRHAEWAVIVALVGGGQEIHDGEAGLAEWGRALVESFTHWEIFASPEAVVGGPNVSGSVLFEHGIPDRMIVGQPPELHLGVSARSYKAESVPGWVNAVLSGDIQGAIADMQKATHFPIILTRSPEAAREWLREDHRRRGSRRSGLVTSSGALRLRPHGIEVSSGFRGGYNFVEWFLADATDIRSSLQLEVAATEFECQGLELDWVGVCWGDDFLRDECEGWRYRRFSGKAWQIIRKPAHRQYLLNKYRVLLTRAREGMVIWIPKGKTDDPTRDPIALDRTADYLRACGVMPLDH